MNTVDTFFIKVFEQKISSRNPNILNISIVNNKIKQGTFSIFYEVSIGNYSYYFKYKTYTLDNSALEDFDEHFKSSIGLFQHDLKHMTFDVDFFINQFKSFYFLKNSIPIKNLHIDTKFLVQDAIKTTPNPHLSPIQLVNDVLLDNNLSIDVEIPYKESNTFINQIQIQYK